MWAQVIFFLKHLRRSRFTAIVGIQKDVIATLFNSANPSDLWSAAKGLAGGASGCGRGSWPHFYQSYHVNLYHVTALPNAESQRRYKLHVRLSKRVWNFCPLAT